MELNIKYSLGLGTPTLSICFLNATEKKNLWVVIINCFIFFFYNTYVFKTMYSIWVNMQLKISVTILKALRGKYSNILQILFNSTTLKYLKLCKKNSTRTQKKTRRISFKFLKKSNRYILKQNVVTRPILYYRIYAWYFIHRYVENSWYPAIPSAFDHTTVIQRDIVYHQSSFVGSLLKRYFNG